MPKVKIGIIVPALTDGGGVPEVARFLFEAACRAEIVPRVISLASASMDKFSVRLSAPGTWFLGVRCGEGEWEGIPFVAVGAMFSELEFQRYLPRKALSELLRDCAVIQVVCGSAAWACSAIGIGKPVSVQVATRVRVERRARDSAPSGFAGRWRKAMTPITDRLERRGLRRAEAVQVENPWMLDFVRNTNAGRELDLRYAPPGIDAKLFSPLPARDLADPYVLCVGRLDDPRKRVDVLLNAFAQLGPVNARLVLAGSSGPTSAFWRNAESLAVRDRVEYVQRPSREALIELYRNAAVFALPSDEEGFGMVLIEAMACGVPVVSTRSGGPDAIVDEGKTGFLVDREDAAAMTDRLRRLLCDRELNLAMGERARDAVEHRYTNEVCGRTFVDVWEKLAARGGTR